MLFQTHNKFVRLQNTNEDILIQFERLKKKKNPY